MVKPEILYNVECMNCGSVWQPLARTPLWWRAKQRADNGKLDAAGATGEECGCIKRVREPNAPFRVFGYDMMCEDFDLPFYRIVDALSTFKKLHADGDIVFISGISNAVVEKLKWA
jgi:hypothetical protein